LFRGPQLVLHEKRNDRLNQIDPLPHAVPIHVLFVVVVSFIDIDSANTKELFKHVETIDASRALSHRKLMCHLETSLVTLPLIAVGLFDEVDRKTTFSIYLTGDPSYLNQPFLLIVRSRVIVTAQFTNTVKG